MTSGSTWTGDSGVSVAQRYRSIRIVGPCGGCTGPGQRSTKPSTSQDRPSRALAKTMTEQWPDPIGDRPPDWDPRHWTVYVAIVRDDLSYRKAGALVGVQPGTVSGWVTKWKQRYTGPWPASSRSGVFTPEARAKGVEAAAAATAEKWSATRATVALDFGEAAGLARQAAVAALHLLVADKARLGALDARDIERLARTADILAERADVLDGVPDATKAFVVQQTNVNVPAGTLDGLETSPGDRSTIDAATSIVERFTLLRGGADEPVEVDEVA